MNKCLNLQYDVVLSFAGEDRNYVEQTASALRDSGVKVFYDNYEDTDLWGKDLYQHLDDIYQNKAKYAVIFISESYRKKLWTNHELKSAQARAFSENEEYILPARFDDTEIPGIRKTVGYIDLTKISPTDFSQKIIKKLGDIQPENFLPNEVNYVSEALQYLYEDIDQDDINNLVWHVFSLLKMTTEAERAFLTPFVIHCCKHDITEDLHEDITLIERVSKLSRDEILERLRSLSNLGFEYKIEKSISGCEEDNNQQPYDRLKVKLISRKPSLVLDNLTVVWALMYLGVMNDMCFQCCIDSLNRLDFSGLQDSINEEELEELFSSVSDFEDEDDDT